MVYQAIARKYRPQKFEEVLGQEHITRTLKNAIKAERLHHAYLFTGVRGVGKTTVARILAKTLNCQRPVDAEPCNECETCKGITAGSNMDVQEIDGASNTGVDDVREIRERLKYLPSQSKYKIYIIDEVHMLSTAAFNALLKTLEEPPPHVVFIFATTEPQKIPATILSRCQRHDFKRMSVPLLIEALKKIAAVEDTQIEPDALTIIAAEAEGSMRDAQSLFDQAIAFAGKMVTYQDLKEILGFMDRSQLKSILTAVASKDSKAALNVVEEVFTSGGNLSRLAQELLAWMKNLYIMKATSDQTFLKDIPSEDRDFIAALSEKLELSEWEQMFRINYRVAEEIVRSKYPKMVMEALCVELSEIKPVRSVEQLMDRLDRALAEPLTNVEEGVVKNVLAGEKKVPAREEKTFNPADRKTIDEVEWKKFMSWLKNERPQLSAILEHGVFVSGGAGKVHVQYLAGSFFADKCKTDKIKLEEYIARYFGSRYEVECSSLDDKTPVQKKDKFEENKTRARELREEALSNDVIKHAANIFGGDITEIRILEPKE